MKKSLFTLSLVSFLFLVSVINLFSQATGRGTILTSTKNEVFIKKLENNETITLQYDANSQLNLITGETIPFDNSKLSLGYTVNYIEEGTKLISMSIDFGGPKGEYILIGGMDTIDVANKFCKVNGIEFKLDSNISYISFGNLVSTKQIKNSLVKVLYSVDNVNLHKIATVIEVITGYYNEFKRTSIIRGVTYNEITIGDPVDPIFQEKLIIHSNSKIYNQNFDMIDKSLLKSGTLIDVYSFYDTITSANFVYEIHVKSIPEMDEFYYTGCPLTKNSVGLLSEFGLFTLLPNAYLSNFGGESKSFDKFLQNKNRIFTANINKSGSFFNLSSAKEIPTYQTESTFEGKLAIESIIPNKSILALMTTNTYGNSIQTLEINLSKTRLKNHAFDKLSNTIVKVTARPGSILNNRSNVYNEVLSIDSISNYFMGVISYISTSDLHIGNMDIHSFGLADYVKIDGSDGNRSDFDVGIFSVNKVFKDSQRFNIIKAYRFNSAEIIGRISEITNESITVGGLSIPISDYTLYRGQGNQVTELINILPNSIVKVISLHGSAEAITEFSGKTFPNSSIVGTIARIVYVLQGPDPVSTNEPVVTPTIFPNPSSTTVSIAAPENVVSDVTISTMLGERVFAKSNVTGTTQFSTASLPIGQYIVKITNNKSTTNQILQVIR